MVKLDSFDFRGGEIGIFFDLSYVETRNTKSCLWCVNRNLGRGLSYNKLCEADFVYIQGELMRQRAFWLYAFVVKLAAVFDGPGNL